MRTPDQIEAIIPMSDRSAQRFPALRPAQLDIVRRFATSDVVHFAPGASIFDVGEHAAPAWFLIEGSADLFTRDGLDAMIPLHELRSGQFTGELHQLAGKPSLAGARAGAQGCVALPLHASQLRALIVGSAELGEMIMRALILRRVGLLEHGAGPVLLGRAGSAGIQRLQAFLTRSAYPHLVLDCASERGRQIIESLDLPPGDLPLLICPGGHVLKHPSNQEAAAWLGITPTIDDHALYDVAVIGSGPAGLAAAVYAASEGLSVLVVDGAVVGGQAGASARIENYLGFPTGISGQALTGRALSQAQKFGAEVAIPLLAERLACHDSDAAADDRVAVTLSDKCTVRARAVVVASGARYRRPDVANLRQFEGDSVHYWASSVEAKLCLDQEIALVGAGNSAGQAVAFLAPQVKRLTMIVRGPSLEASMSRYLIDRIKSLQNVDIRMRSELVTLNADRTSTLESVTIRDNVTAELATLPVRQVFLFIGAEPNTAWLDGCLSVDKNGYVLTGQDASDPNGRMPLSLQTSLPRVFAIGDVRAGSTKRVASAVGEGAAVVAQIHALLGAASTTA